MFSTSVFAQERIYINSDNDTVSSEEEWLYYIQNQFVNEDLAIIREERINKNGQLIWQRDFKLNENDKKVYHGKYLRWYTDGQLYTDFDYKEGLLEGKVLMYWNNGQLKRNQVYEKDIPISGSCFDSLGNTIVCNPLYDSPMFKGGISEMHKFLATNIVYPKYSLKNKEEGIVSIDFVVLKDGTLSNIKVGKSVTPHLDEEAMRVISLMSGYWSPGYQLGEKVNVKLRAPVKFSIK